MPVRNMLYDAIQYSGQVTSAEKSYKKSSEKPKTSAEYLSGFHHDDKLIPVVTLVIYFGAEKWNAPVTLHEMLDLKEKRLLKYIPDYRINLITPESIADDDFEKFQTDLQLIFQSIKYSQDRQKMEVILNQNPAYSQLSRETAEMISITTNTKMKMKKGEEFFDMCKAFSDMRAEGKAEGILEEKVSLAKNLLAEGTFSNEKIASLTGLPIEEVTSLAEKKN